MIVSKKRGLSNILTTFLSTILVITLILGFWVIYQSSIISTGEGSNKILDRLLDDIRGKTVVPSTECTDNEGYCAPDSCGTNTPFPQGDEQCIQENQIPARIQTEA